VPENYLGSVLTSPLPQMPQMPGLNLPPVRQARPKRNFLEKLGTVADAFAMAGGVEPVYRTEMTRRQQMERAEQVRQARARLAANPNDEEAFAFLFQEGPEQAVAARNALRPPGPQLMKVGTNLVRVGEDGTVESVFEAPQSVSPSADIQLIERLTEIFGGDRQKAVEYWSQIKLPPTTAAIRRGGGGTELFQVDRAPSVPRDPRSVFQRMLTVESGGRQFDANGRPLTSSAGAIGIAQVMPGTAPEAAALAGLPFDENRYRTDPEYNRALGEAYFNEMLRQFGDIERAVAAYNAGPAAVRQAIQRGGDNWLSQLPAETRAYVPKVLGGQGGARRLAVTPDAPPRPVAAPRGAAGKEDDGSRAEARARLGETLSGLATTYASLDRRGFAPSAERGLVSNVRNYVAGTGIGQRVGRALGSEDQRLRERVNSLRPAIIAQLKQVTGMSAQQMNSNVELQFFLNMATDPTQDVEANLFAVDQLDKLFGPGDTLRKALPPDVYARVQRAGIDSRPLQGGPVAVTSAAEARALPPGTMFRTPDGQVRVRR
jgi:hypothetical protein